MRTIPWDVESVDKGANAQASKLEVHLLGMLASACQQRGVEATILRPTLQSPISHGTVIIG